MSNDTPVINQVFDRLGGIEARLKNIEAQVTKTNGRVNSLERVRWMLAGAGSVLLFVSGAVAKAFNLV